VLAALRGLSVAIVEKAEWGGTCLNRGCVPKKDWYSTARLLEDSRGFAPRGITGCLEPDIDAAWRHQRRVVERVRGSYTDYLARLRVVAFRGRASFADAHTVVVDGNERITTRHAVIATGSRPFVPQSLPLAPGRVLTTDDLFDRPVPPGRRVAVIGSGTVGTEMAFILTRLGLDVVWLMQSAPLGRSRFSHAARKALTDALMRAGVVPRTGSRPLNAETTARGVRLVLPDGGVEDVDWVLLGTGRVPMIEGLALGAAGVVTDAGGFIRVNPRQQTAVPHVYAIGDVANPAMTSNHALAEAAVAVADMVTPGSRMSDPRAVPEAVYSAVELARVGLSEEMAEDAGREAATGFAGFEVNPAALGEDASEGFARVVADADTGELLGAEIVGRDAGELIHLADLNADPRRALSRLAAAFYNHPTRAEELQNSVETLAAKWALGDAVFGLKE
jgi:dihydrolipoyl dehydrogenase